MVANHATGPDSDSALQAITLRDFQLLPPGGAADREVNLSYLSPLSGAGAAHARNSALWLRADA